jgi:ketosteroid isomerase-like protein
MNKIKITASCLALISCTGSAIALTDEEAKAQVIAQEKAWSDAVIHYDIAKVASILADDFIGIDGRGFVTDKAAELKEAESPAADSTAPQLIREDLSDFTARVYGNTAVLNLTNTAHFSSKGNESSVKYRRTTVWVRDAGSWRCVSFHGSRVLEPPKN